MSLAILQTKLYAPKHPLRANIIRRPRLTERLSAGLTSKVTLLSAPAGFGKSTLLGEWMAHLRNDAANESSLVKQKSKIVNVAWLTLDNDDNDPVRFLAYLIVSLQKFAITVGETAMGLLQAPGGFPDAQVPKTILTALINNLSILAEDNSPPQQPDVPAASYVLALPSTRAICAP